MYFYSNIESRHVGFRSKDCSDRNMRIRRVQAPYRKVSNLRKYILWEISWWSCWRVLLSHVSNSRPITGIALKN